MSDHAERIAEQIGLVVRSWSMCPIEEFDQHVSGLAEELRSALPAPSAPPEGPDAWVWRCFSCGNELPILDADHVPCGRCGSREFLVQSPAPPAQEPHVGDATAYQRGPDPASEAERRESVAEAPREAIREREEEDPEERNSHYAESDEPSFVRSDGSYVEAPESAPSPAPGEGREPKKPVLEWRCSTCRSPIGTGRQCKRCGDIYAEPVRVGVGPAPDPLHLVVWTGERYSVEREDTYSGPAEPACHCGDQVNAERIAAALNGEAEVAELRERVSDLEAELTAASLALSRQPAPLAPPEGEPAFRVIEERGHHYVEATTTGERIAKCVTAQGAEYPVFVLNRLFAARPAAAPPAPEGEPVAQSPALDFLVALGREIATQDGMGTPQGPSHSTSWPVYHVEQQERSFVDGMDVDPDGHEEEEDGTLRPYVLRWRLVPGAVSLTRSGIEEYLRLNGHNLRQARIYVGSMNRVPAMQQLVSALKSLPVVAPSVPAPPPAPAPPDALRRAAEALFARPTPSLKNGQCTSCGAPVAGWDHHPDCRWQRLRAALDAAPPGEGVPELLAALRESRAWSREQFPGQTPASIAAHLAEEATELAAAPESTEEMADVAMLLYGLADARSVGGETLAAAVRAKLAICRERDWTDTSRGYLRAEKRAAAPPPVVSEEVAVFDAYVAPVVAGIRDAIRAEGQREEDDRDAELESALRGLVAALDRKAGQGGEGVA